MASRLLGQMALHLSLASRDGPRKIDCRPIPSFLFTDGYAATAPGFARVVDHVTCSGHSLASARRVIVRALPQAGRVHIACIVWTGVRTPCQREAQHEADGSHNTRIHGNPLLPIALQPDADGSKKPSTRATAPPVPWWGPGTRSGACTGCRFTGLFVPLRTPRRYFHDQRGAAEIRSLPVDPCTLAECQ